MEFDIEAILARDYTPIHKHEVFQLMLARFDITKAWKMVQKWDVETRRKRLLWARPGNGSLIRIDESRVEGCDITVPVLMATLEETTPLCIDGWHRNEKAHRMKLEQIPAFQFTTAETKKIRLI